MRLPNPQNPSLHKLIQFSKDFHAVLGYNTKHNLIQNIDADHESEAASTRIIVHPSVVTLAERYLELKKNGNQIERAVYQEMNTNQFISRLITKRPLAFLSASDRTRLRNGECLDGYAKWPLVGTMDERPPLILQDYLSYGEMAISALLGVSSYTTFINKGDRYNCAKPQPPNSFIRNGIYIGLVGARFERPEFMESRFCFVQDSHTLQNGYGKRGDPEMDMWADFYCIDWFPTLDQVDLEQAARVYGGFIDLKAYKARMKITVELLLKEAEQRAQEYHKKAYVHVVGLGLGVWQMSSAQRPVFVNLFKECLEMGDYKNIQVIDFSYISEEDCDLQNGSIVNGVDIYFSKRDPAQILPKKYDNCLLVATFAWDGNFLPGNEIYLGSLRSSSCLLLYYL